MEIGEKTLEYARGELFDVGYSMPIQENEFMFRTDGILKLTKGKKVLHVGCCDHKDLILEKIKNNEWLQGLLDKNCSEVVGIDINRDALKFIEDNHLTTSRLLYNDIISAPPIDGGKNRLITYCLGRFWNMCQIPLNFFGILMRSTAVAQIPLL